MPINTQSSGLPDAYLRKALAYWERKRSARDMPRRADIDAVEIPDLLPYIRLVDMVAPGQYRYHLVGTEVEQFHGGLKFNGRLAQEALPPALAERIIPVYDDCVRARPPVFLEDTFLAPDNERVARHSRVLYLPLSEDDQAVSMVLVVEVFGAIEPALRTRSIPGKPNTARSRAACCRASSPSPVAWRPARHRACHGHRSSPDSSPRHGRGAWRSAR